MVFGAWATTTTTISSVQAKDSNINNTSTTIKPSTVPQIYNSYRIDSVQVLFKYVTLTSRLLKYNTFSADLFIPEYDRNYGKAESMTTPYVARSNDDVIWNYKTGLYTYTNDTRFGNLPDIIITLDVDRDSVKDEPAHNTIKGLFRQRLDQFYEHELPSNLAAKPTGAIQFDKLLKLTHSFVEVAYLDVTVWLNYTTTCLYNCPK